MSAAHSEIKHPQTAQVEKKEPATKTTDNQHIKIDEKKAPQASDDKIGLTVFQNLLGHGADNKLDKKSTA